MAKSPFLFEESSNDRPGVTVFTFPSESGRYTIAGKSLVCVIWILGLLALARYLAHTAHDWWDRCALYGGALFLAAPMMMALHVWARTLWARSAVIINSEEGTLSEIYRTPFKEKASHHSLSEVLFVVVVPEGSTWNVLIELAGDSFVFLGFANKEESARALAHRTGAVLKVPIRDEAPGIPSTASEQ